MASYKTIRLVYAACLAAAAFSFSAQASSFSNLYVFGDSLSDLGNAYLATGAPKAPYSNGRFSNGNIWVQDLAPVLGIKTPTASLAGGTDFAVGGSVTTTNLNPGDLGSQLGAFKAANPVVDPNALYSIWIGANDLNAILASNPTQAQAAAAALKVVANIDGAITTLASEGAKNFLIIDVPDLGKTPAAIATGPVGVAASSSLSQFFDNALFNGNSAAGIPSLSTLESLDGINSLYTLDTYSLIDSIVANPNAYGLSNATQQCLTGALPNYQGGGTVCANPNQYLFWDHLHPTAAGQAIVAQDVALVLSPEPATWTTSLAGGLTLAAFGFVVARNRKNSLVN